MGHPKSFSTESARALEILQQPLSAAEQQATAAYLKRARSSLVKLQEVLDAEKPLNFDALNTLRLAPSSTLLKAAGQVQDLNSAQPLVRWIQCSDWVAQSVQEGRGIDWGAIAEVHSALIGSHAELSPLRSSEVQGGNCTYPPASDLPILLQEFQKGVLSKLGEGDPLVEAAAIYQWLVSLHFFPDGNGRLARLIADWRLAQAGFPPIGFPNDAASFVSVLDKSRAFSPSNSIVRVCEGVENSITAMLKL